MEIWKYIEKLDCQYAVSTFGRVASVEDVIVKSNGQKYTRKSKIIKPQSRNGYLRVRISLNGVKSTHTVHRLVAEAFIDNPLNKTEVNHIDEDKLNNHVSNLEWTTPKENVRHSFRLGKRKTASKKNKAKMVLNVNTGIYYKSLLEASKSIDGVSYSGIQHQMNGVCKNTTGLIYV